MPAGFRLRPTRMHDPKTQFGLLRSWLIYYGQPFARRRLRRFYGQFVRPDGICFDIGAHLGNRTQAFLDLGARVVAVEPQPDCAAYLKRRFGRQPGFTLVAKAIGAQAGTATLQINRMNPAIATMAPAEWRNAMAAAAWSRERWDRRVEVEVTTLSRLVEQFGRPHFCKIDVEGYESQALAGLECPLPALSFEFISIAREIAVECIRRLQRLGAYRFNWSFREELRLGAPEWRTPQAAEKMLRLLGSRVVSGDVYARLGE